MITALNYSRLAKRIDAHIKDIQAIIGLTPNKVQKSYNAKSTYGLYLNDGVRYLHKILETAQKTWQTEQDTQQ